MLGKEAPAGAYLDTPSLESTCSVYLRHKTRGSLFVENRMCISGGKKAPAGAHLDAPSLDNTESAYVKHRDTDSVYVIHRNLCLRHRQCAYFQHRNSVRTAYKLCICNIEFASFKHIICIFETYNLYPCGIYLYLQ